LTVADLIIENKYLTQNLKVLRPENYFNFIFGVNYGKGGFGLDFSLNFRAFKNFPIYVEDKQGFYLVEFEKMQFTELKLSGIFNYRRNEFTFKGVFRSSYNAKSKKPVPYFPSFSSEVGYRYVFPFGLAIVTEISLISNRVVDFDGNEIGGYVLSSLGVEYVVFKNFKVFAWFDNLLSRRYYIWKDYLEPNLIFLGGIEYKF
jgi:outer membrane receptor protein involved in Fe transport